MFPRSRLTIDIRIIDLRKHGYRHEGFVGISWEKLGNKMGTKVFMNMIASFLEGVNYRALPSGRAFSYGSMNDN